jgi:hypothetical protein
MAVTYTFPCDIAVNYARMRFYYTVKKSSPVWAAYWAACGLYEGCIMVGCIVGCMWEVIPRPDAALMQPTVMQPSVQPTMQPSCSPTILNLSLCKDMKNQTIFKNILYFNKSAMLNVYLSSKCLNYVFLFFKTTNSGKTWAGLSFKIYN